jgi:hypothetical protein
LLQIIHPRHLLSLLQFLLPHLFLGLLTLLVLLVFLV